MAKINNMPPRGPVWPWGGPRAVEERLVRPGQVSKKKGKKGDPKNPPLASWELLDFIGPAHSADELRLPEPPMPQGHEADLEAFNDRPFLQSAVDRGDGGGQSQMSLESSLDRIQVSPERKDRLRAILDREQQMVGLVSHLNEAIKEVQRKMRDEQSVEGV